MKKNENGEKSFPKKVGGKGRIFGVVLCFVAAIVMVGSFTVRGYQKKMNDEIAKSKELAQRVEEDNQETTANDIVIPGKQSENDKSSQTEGTDSQQNEGTKDGTSSTEGGQETASNSADSVWFSEDSVLAWPASGSVILDYSMDHTIYFPTLAEYRYNPALIIAGTVGEDIRAGSAGIVADIKEDARTGNTVTLDLGNGYSASYGQLKDISLHVGDYVEKGNIVGYLSGPTKYYAEEGTNLYFAMKKNEASVNPMDFME